MTKKRINRARLPDPETIMGFDISSVCVGFALFESGDPKVYGKLILEGKYAGQKLSDFYIKAKQVIAVHKPDLVIVEKPFRGQGRAFEVLVQYHAALKMALHDVLGRALLPEHGLTARQIKKTIEEEYLNSHNKKSPKPLFNGNDHATNKKNMVSRINQLYGLQLRYKKNDPSKKISDDDIADAIATVHAWLLLHNG